MVPRGWFREAAIKLKTPKGKIYYVQATTWRDKKQVCFLSNSTVCASKGITVKRHVKNEPFRANLAGVHAQQEYIGAMNGLEFPKGGMNGVDRNDQDSEKYYTTIRTNRYYLRIESWGLDRVIHMLYQIVKYCVTMNIGPAAWKEYVSKNEGRREFQMDLGIYLMNFGLLLDWDGDPGK